MREILQTRKLSAGYAQRVVVADVDLEVRTGEILTLIGPNGAGKSTVLKTIAGQLEPIGGSVYLDGKEQQLYPPNELARKQSVMLTERISGERMTCEEVVSLGRYPYTGHLGILSDEDRRVIHESMKLVRVEELADRDHRAISDGQRQRVLLARAICQEPEIMILDEPTSYLDIRYKLEFLELLRKLVRERSIGAVLSLHELELAHSVSDRVVCVSAYGEILRTGTPAEVFRDEVLSELYGMEPGRITALYRPFLDSMMKE